jgi:ankyrin repeat protein
VNARNDEGATPLLWAVRCGNYRLLELLIEHGADINVRNLASHGGVTPLHEAVMAGDHAATKILVNAGADLTLKTEGGETVGDIAKGRGDVSLGALLIK